MLFSSITFLYIFLPLVLLLYAFVPEQGRNLVLLLMSLLFYAWGEPIYVLLMLAQIGIVYVLSGFKGRIFFSFYPFLFPLLRYFILNFPIHFLLAFRSIPFSLQVIALMYIGDKWHAREILLYWRHM